MNKGQRTEDVIKNILKFFKMNENQISTAMGGVVILVIIGLIFNYFRTTNLKSWQGILLNQGGVNTTTEEVKKVESESVIYKVVKGDDLWHISEKFYGSGYNYVDIMKENKLTSGVITEGMELKMPKIETKQVIAKKEEVKVENKKIEGTNSSSISSGEYVTVHGDTFWNIAVRAYGDGYQWTKIYQANKNIFPNPNLIHAEVKISIP